MISLAYSFYYPSVRYVRYLNRYRVLVRVWPLWTILIFDALTSIFNYFYCIYLHHIIIIYRDVTNLTINFYNAGIILYNVNQRLFFICHHHKCLSWLIPLHMNTQFYAAIINYYFSLPVRGPILAAWIWRPRRQILKSKVGPRWRG